METNQEKLARLIQERDHADAMVSMYISMGDFITTPLWMMTKMNLGKEIKELEEQMRQEQET